MFQLQLSLNADQTQYLATLAEREGASMAEVVLRLLDDEARRDSGHDPDSLWGIVGLIKDELPLIDGIAVSDDPDLYLYGRRPDSPVEPVPPRMSG